MEDEKKFALKWIDEASMQKRSLAEEGPDEEDLVQVILYNKINPPAILNHR